jgi:uncharacterized OB-fold protein
MENGVKFCPSCGTLAGGVAPSPKPATEKMGNIIKYPSCGAVVPAMTAFCPDCGHEFRNVQASGTIKAFTEKIQEFDMVIASEPDWSVGTGWSYWSTKQKGWWIILNCFTIAIPQIIITLIKFGIPKLSDLSATEKEKKSYIENFLVPNTREDIMEFVMFAGSRVERLIGGPESKDLALIRMWAKVWSDKCQQLIARARVALSGDSKTLSAITTMLEKPEKLIERLKKIAYIKLGVMVLGIMAIVIFLAVNYG